MLWLVFILSIPSPEDLTVLAKMMSNSHFSDEGQRTVTTVEFRRDSKGLMMILVMKYGDGGEQAAMEERRIIYVGAITQASIFGGSGLSHKQDVRVLIKHRKLDDKGPLTYKNEQADFSSVEALLVGTYNLNTARKVAAELVHWSTREGNQLKNATPKP